MGKFTQSFMDFLNLNDDEYDDYDDYDDIDEEEQYEKKPKKSKQRFDDDSEDEKAATKSRPVRVKPVQRTSKVVPMRASKASGMEVCVIKPNSMDDARELCETLLSNRAVVLNLEGVHIEIAQRIVDFTSGACFAVSGNFQKISNYIYIVTPASVDISGDFQELFSNGFGKF